MTLSFTITCDEFQGSAANNRRTQVHLSGVKPAELVEALNDKERAALLAELVEAQQERKTG